MVTTTLSSENYRGFTINELLRDFIFTDAINRGGFVYAKKPVGNELISAGADKLGKELGETQAEYNKGRLDELATEAADVLDVADIFAPHIKEDALADRVPLSNLVGKLDFLRQVALKPGLSEDIASSMLGGLLAEVRSFVARTYVNGGASIGRKALEAARKAKNEAKGPHNGWYGLVIILPKDDEWCPTFAAKYEEITDLSQFNIDMALTLDHFTVPRASG